jgi:hypothetical protein
MESFLVLYFFYFSLSHVNLEFCQWKCGRISTVQKVNLVRIFISGNIWIGVHFGKHGVERLQQRLSVRKLGHGGRQTKENTNSLLRQTFQLTLAVFTKISFWNNERSSGKRTRWRAHILRQYIHTIPKWARILQLYSINKRAVLSAEKNRDFCVNYLEMPTYIIFGVQKISARF